MVMNSSNSYPLLFLLLSFWLIAGCSLPWAKSTPESNPTAATLLKEGNEAVKKKSYKKALVKYATIRSDYPFSAEARKIDLRVAETYHLNKQYAEAIETYKEFLGFQPTNEKAPYVLYQLGEINLEQFKSIDRDEKIIETAKSYYETLIKKHPKSPYVPKAKEKIARCRLYLAQREYYIGDFYLKQKKYRAAKERFASVVRNYLDTPVAVKALYLLGKAYRLEKNGVKATLAYESIIRHYPDNPLAKQARVQLSKLENLDRDPLAQLLMRDGNPPPGIPSQPATLYGAGQPQGQDNPKLVKKKAVDYEDGNNGDQGFFADLVASINPFDSSDDESSKQPKQPMEEQKKETAATNRASNGTAQSQVEPEKGFFSRLADTINPFASDDKNNHEAQSNSQLATYPSSSGTQGGGSKGAVIDSIDQSLQQRGIQKTDEKAVFHSPVPELSQIPKEPPPTDTKEILGAIDTGLKKQGSESMSLPPPPEASSKLFANRKKKKEIASQTKASTTAVLGAIDKGLNQKGVEVPEEKQTPTDSTGSKTGAPPSVQASAPPVKETQELRPRMGTSDSPLLLDAGQFQWEAKPAPTEEKNRETVKSANQPANSDKLSDAVLIDPWNTPPNKKETKTAKSSKKNPANEDAPQGVAESIERIINPFGF